MPVPPPKRIARVNTSADDIIASRPPRQVIRDEDYNPGDDLEIFDAPMPMGTDEWDTPVIGGNFYNDDIPPIAVNTVPAAAVTRGVHIPNNQAEPLPDPRRRVARVSGGLVHTPVAEPTGFSITPATGLALGAIGLAGGAGIYGLMNGDNEEEQRRQQYQQQQMMMQQRGY